MGEEDNAGDSEATTISATAATVMSNPTALSSTNVLNMAPKVAEETSVRVAVRVRPFLAQEKEEKALECVVVRNDQQQIQMGQKVFTFDRVYDLNAEQQRIFEESVMPLVDSSFAGYNATILAYGQTGSGKTYTMGSCNSQNLGEEELGVIPRVIEEVFKRIEKLKNERVFTLRCSFIEIYNEELRDLLDRDMNKSLLIREDPAGGICVVGVREVEVRQYDELLCLLEKGSIARATGSTLMNSVSSRSHAIFTLSIEQQRLLSEIDNPDGNANNVSALDDSQVGESVRSKFHFVDLAGSERLKRTQAVGARMKEGVSINQGLLALGNVISALGDEKKRAAGGAIHVPYRDAKLTRLLQDSLGGNSRTLMFACISPADSNFEETISTLKYANRARNIKNKPVVNRDVNTNLLYQLRAQIALLERELQEYRTGVRKAGEDTFNQHQHQQQQQQSQQQQQQQQQQQALLDIEKRPVGPTTHKQTDGKVVGLESEIAMLRLEMTEAQQSLAVFLVGEKENADLSGTAFDTIRLVEKRLRQVLTGQFLDDSTDDANQGGDESTNQSVLLQGHDEAEFAAGQRRLQGELADLDHGLSQKEKLLQELLQSRQQYEVLSLNLEGKIAELEQRSRQLNAEKEEVQHEMQSTQHLQPHREDTLEKYNVKLRSLELELTALKKKQREHEKLRRINEKNDERISILQKEVDMIKQSKAQLMRKMREDAKSYRDKTKIQDNKISALQREVSKDQKKITQLEKQTTRQQYLISRREEQLQHFQAELAKSQESYIALTRAKARASQISRRSALPPKTARGGKSNVSSIDEDSIVAGNDPAVPSSSSTSSSSTAVKSHWIFDVVEEKLNSKHAISTIEREKDQRKSLQAELDACMAQKRRLEAGKDNAAADLFVGMTLFEDVASMTLAELEDHIEYLQAEIEFKDMTIKEASELLGRPHADLQSKVKCLDVEEARTAVTLLTDELTKRGEECGKYGEQINELMSRHHEMRKALMEDEDRRKEMQKDFDARTTALQSEYEEKVLFLLEQLRGEGATPGLSAISKVDMDANNRALADDLEREHFELMAKQHGELQTELEKAKVALEQMHRECIESEKREKQLRMKLETAEEMRKNAEGDLRKLQSACLAENTVKASHMGQPLLEKLNQVWDDMGLGTSERMKQMENITQGVSAISEHTLSAESHRRDTMKQELSSVKAEIHRLHRVLGDDVDGSSSPRSTHALPLTAQLQKAKAQLHQLHLRQDVLKAQLHESHSKLRLLLAELDQSEIPSFAVGLTEWREQEVSADLLKRYEEAIKQATSAKSDKLVGVAKTCADIHVLWKDLGIEPNPSNVLDMAIKRILEGTDSSATVYPKTVRDIELCRNHLRQVQAQRTSVVESLDLTLRSHWAALDIPSEAQEKFQKEHRGLGNKEVEAREKELKRLKELLESRLKQTKEAVIVLWDELKISQRARDQFWRSTQDEVTLEALCALQIEKAKLETKKQSLRVIVSLLAKRDNMLQRMKEFEEKASDRSRLFKGSSADRLEEERFRLKVSREYPRIHESLKSQIAVWEQAYGERFSDGELGFKDSLDDNKLGLLHLRLLSGGKDVQTGAPSQPMPLPVPPASSSSSSSSTSMLSPTAMVPPNSVNISNVSTTLAYPTSLGGHNISMNPSNYSFFDRPKSASSAMAGNTTASVPIKQSRDLSPQRQLAPPTTRLSDAGARIYDSVRSSLSNSNNVLSSTTATLGSARLSQDFTALTPRNQILENEEKKSTAFGLKNISSSSVNNSTTATAANKLTTSRPRTSLS